mgnify:CR=1 FL=1
MKRFSKGSKRLLSVLLSGAMLAGTCSSVAVGAADEKEANFARALQYSIYFYDGNMCGTEVQDNNRYTWRGNCHTYDAQVAMNSTATNLSADFLTKYKDILDPDGDGYIDVAGGFHDAGDHVKFGMPENYSAATLGWGYYEFRDAYQKTGQDDHIETILRYFNDYLMKCTFLDSNGDVIAHCYQVGDGDIDHAYWNAPELDEMDRPAFFLTGDKPQTDYVASAAASLAINYLNFKDTDPEYAQKCLDYALALYDFSVKTHHEVGDDTLTVDSLGYDGGFYTSSYDYDELSWAAVWLYYCTENYDYIDDIISVDESVTGEMGAHPYTGYMKRIIKDTGNCWQNIWVHCWDTVWGGVFAKLAPVTNISRDWYIFRWNLEFWSGLGEADAAKADFDVPVTKHKYFGMDDQLWNTKITASEIKDLPETDGAWIAKSPAGFAVVSDYGSARYNTAAGLCAMVYAKETDDLTFAEWAKDQMEYILGDNPMGYSFEVGYENSYATHPHHRSSSCSSTQSMDEPDPQTHTLWGALVGGPDLKDYHNDVTSDYIYNEVTDDYNAGFCGDLAGLYHFYGTEGKELADKNAVIPDFNMSENAKAGYEVDENTPTGFYVTAGKAQENKAGLQVKIVIHNRTINPPQFCNDLRVRYYFNIDELTAIGEDISMVETRVDYDAESAMTNNKTSATISEPVKYDDNGTYYIEIAWENCNFYGSRVYQFGLLNKMNPDTYDTTWDSSNDYSYSDLISFEDDNDAAAITKKIPAYANGKLVWGEEPDGTKPSETTDVTTTGTTDKGTATTTTAATVSGSGSGSSVLYGDVNLDSRIDITDAVLLNRAVSDTVKLNEQAALNADCDANGELSGNDAVVLLKFLVHIETTLPVSETA